MRRIEREPIINQLLTRGNAKYGLVKSPTTKAWRVERTRLINEAAAKKSKRGNEDVLMLMAPLIYKFIRGMQPCFNKQQWDDIAVEASRGVMEAVTRWDPERGVSFAHYAMFWVMKYVYAYARSVTKEKALKGVVVSEDVRDFSAQPDTQPSFSLLKFQNELKKRGITGDVADYIMFVLSDSYNGHKRKPDFGDIDKLRSAIMESLDASES